MPSVPRLEAAKCGLLVVDIQERLMPVIHERERVIKNSTLLIKAANILKIPLMVTTQYAARIGSIVPEVQAEIQGQATLDKFEFDCFRNLNFRERLNSKPEIDTWLVCGVETHICIYQTMLGGLEAGYRMWVASDAVSSRRPENYGDGLQRIRQMGGTVGSVEMIIYELLVRADRAEFKTLLPFLK